MKRLLEPTLRGVLALATSLVLLGFTRPVYAVRDATTEAGRWVGFGHEGKSLDPGTRFSLDLTAVVGAAPGALTGVINGLPAIQMPLQVSGSVSRMGRITLTLTGEGTTGFCDGSVRNLLNFRTVGGQDDIGDLNYSVTDPAGLIHRGHLRMIHLFGGLGWSQVTGPNLTGAGKGSSVLLGENVAVPGSSQIDNELGSSLGGGLVVGKQDFALVGTVNELGSLIMMCDGSVRNADGQTTSLIGLLFTGGVRNLNSGEVGLPAIQHVVGNFGMGGNNGFLPFLERQGALSILIGL